MANPLLQKGTRAFDPDWPGQDWQDLNGTLPPNAERLFEISEQLRGVTALAEKAASFDVFLDAEGADPTGVLPSDDALDAALAKMRAKPSGRIVFAGRYLLNRPYREWPGDALFSPAYASTELRFADFDVPGPCIEPLFPIEFCDNTSIQGIRVVGDGVTTTDGLLLGSAHQPKVADCEFQGGGFTVSSIRLFGQRFMDGSLRKAGVSPMAVLSADVAPDDLTIPATDATQYQPSGVIGLVHAQTTLAVAIKDYETTATVASTAGLPTSGMLYIEQEPVLYTLDGGILTLVRHWDTLAASHAIGATVSLVELVRYTARDRHGFTGCTRGVNGSAALPFTAGDPIQQNPGDVAGNAEIANVRAIGGDVASVYATGTTGGSTAKLNGAIDDSQTTITFVSTVQLPLAPSAFMIDDELMTCTGRTSTQATGVTRGVGGTTPASHADGTHAYGATLLDGAIDDSQTTITVKTTSGFWNATAKLPGMLLIDGEVFIYTGKTPTQFLGVRRGWGFTTAKAHADGAVVYNVKRQNGGQSNQVSTKDVRAGGQDPNASVAGVWIEQGSSCEVDRTQGNGFDCFRSDWFSTVFLHPVCGTVGTGGAGVRFGGLCDWTNDPPGVNGFVLIGHTDFAGGSPEGFIVDDTDRNSWWGYKTGLHVGDATAPEDQQYIGPNSFWRKNGIMYLRDNTGTDQRVIPASRSGVLTAGFEQGMLGATPTTTDKGDATPLDVVLVGAGATLVYDGTHAFTGTQSLKIATGGSAAQAYVGWQAAVGTATEFDFDIYLYLSAAGPALTIALFINGALNSAKLNLTAARKLQLFDAANTSLATFTQAIPTGQWVKIHVHVVCSATVGSFKVTLSDPLGVFTTETQNPSPGALNTGAQVTKALTGVIGATASVPDMWLDAEMFAPRVDTDLHGGVLTINPDNFSFLSGSDGAGKGWVSDGAGAMVWTDLATQAELDAHTGLTTSAHGGIVAATDPRLTDARTPTAHHASHETGGGDAIAHLAGSVIDTGTVAAARLPTLDAITGPAADVALGTHKLSGVGDPSSAQDAATKNYVDTGTATLTNKRVTKRVQALVDAATVTLDTDDYDGGYLATLSQATTFAAPSPSTPTRMQPYILRIKSAASQTLTWNGIFRGSTSIALPAATTGGGKWDYFVFLYHFDDTKWDLVGLPGAY